uniref:Bactericidal permeability-increasing protein n=1 Tax=Sphenodon punctatus TaxID=8508 RepID=A0A8D0LCZ6_SPHPU
MASLCPQVEKMYPDRPMKLKVSAASAPFLNITPGKLSLTPDVDIQAYAILEDSSLAPLFLLSMRSTISTNITMSSTKITGSLQLGKMQLTLKHSDVGPFSVQLLQSIMNFFAANVLIPQVNGESPGREQGRDSQREGLSWEEALLPGLLGGEETGDGWRKRLRETQNWERELTVEKTELDI